MRIELEIRGRRGALTNLAAKNNLVRSPENRGCIKTFPPWYSFFHPLFYFAFGNSGSPRERGRSLDITHSCRGCSRQRTRTSKPNKKRSKNKKNIPFYGFRQILYEHVHFSGYMRKASPLFLFANFAPLEKKIFSIELCDFLFQISFFILLL